MIRRFLPTTEHNSLLAQFAEVRNGDTIYLPKWHKYTVDTVNLRGLHGITLVGRDAFIYPTAGSGLDLFDCNDWTILDLYIDGGKPNEAGYVGDVRSSWRGINLSGCDRVSMKRMKIRHMWGDGYRQARFGEGEEALCHGCILDDSHIWDVGRHGVCTVGSDGSLILKTEITDVARTLFNFEVHPNYVVRDWEANGITSGWHRLNTITMTGEGDIDGVTFDGLSLPPEKHFLAEVYGPGAEGYGYGDGRDYGERANVRLANINGGAMAGNNPNYLKFVCVNGLDFRDMNPIRPMVTAGSKLIVA